MERPILMSAPMARAILAGEKTQTRRVCKPAEKAGLSFVVPLEPPGWFGNEEGGVEFKSPYGARGDRLWVREAWALIDADYKRANLENATSIVYRADGLKVPNQRDPEVRAIFADKFRVPLDAIKWRPSIHMPRIASRLTLEITAVRVERLQDISSRDCLAEGIAEVEFRPDDGFPMCLGYMVGPNDGKASLKVTPQEAYRELWEQINGPGSWELNPWVWVVEFKRVA